jgi:hypothetical protein
VDPIWLVSKLYLIIPIRIDPLDPWANTGFHQPRNRWSVFHTKYLCHSKSHTRWVLRIRIPTVGQYSSKYVFNDIVAIILCLFFIHDHSVVNSRTAHATVFLFECNTKQIIRKTKCASSYKFQTETRFKFYKASVLFLWFEQRINWNLSKSLIILWLLFFLSRNHDILRKNARLRRSIELKSNH